LSFTDAIAHHQIELLPKVSETLKELSTRHRLILVTKGDHAEQTGKLQRSGLAPHFAAVEKSPFTVFDGAVMINVPDGPEQMFIDAGGDFLPGPVLIVEDETSSLVNKNHDVLVNALGYLVLTRKELP